jgi:hypothetical protein
MRNIVILLTFLTLVIPVFGQTISHSPDTCEIKYDSALKRSYYTYVDKMPSFKGGLDAMIKTINKNLKWPGGHCDIEGNVFVVCIIESDGRLTNKRIIKGLNNSKGCNADNAALNVIDFLTNWIPRSM